MDTFKITDSYGNCTGLSPGKPQCSASGQSCYLVMLSFYGKQKLGLVIKSFVIPRNSKNERENMYSVLLKLSVKLVFRHRLSHKCGKVSSAGRPYHYCSARELERFVYTYKVILRSFDP